MFINNSDKKVHFFLPDIIHSEVMVSTKFHEKPSRVKNDFAEVTTYYFVQMCAQHDFHSTND